MAHRLGLQVLIALAIAVLVGQTASSAADKSHEGLVVKVSGDQMTMTNLQGKNQHTHNVPKEAKITVDGKPAQLSDLKEGFHVTVWMNDEKAVAKIVAHSKAK